MSAPTCQLEPGASADEKHGPPQDGSSSLNPPPGVRTEAIEVGLDARKACIEERSVVGNYVSTAEVRLTTQTGPSHPHPGVGGV
ncbi:MAG: hypothetical protein GX934_08820, partial [Burkholderiales bacterium]|nr:hypothetical protein [Burkholderiales bacterium]